VTTLIFPCLEGIGGKNGNKKKKTMKLNINDINVKINVLKNLY